MDTKIKIKDRFFTPYISREKIAEAVGHIASQINKELAGKNPLFLCVLNGAFVFAADLFRELTIESEISFIRMKSYEGMRSTGESFKLIMQQLDEQEAALTALFMGTTQTETVVKHIDYIPVEEVTNEVVFRISDLYGIVNAENLSGTPVYLTLKITEEGQLPIDNKGNIKQMPKNAVAYAIPGKAEITLSNEGKTLFKENLPIAQFGVIFGLDPSIFTDKKNPSCATFYPQTGAIRQIGK